MVHLDILFLNREEKLLYKFETKHIIYSIATLSKSNILKVSNGLKGTQYILSVK